MSAEPSGRLARWREHDHTRGSLLASLAVLALPLLATNLTGAVLYQVVDLVFLSRLGDAPMAAVIIANQTIWQVVMMLALGGSFATQALLAGAVGAGDRRRAERIAAQVLVVGAGLAAIVMAASGFAGPLFRLTGAEPSFAAHGVPYLRLQLLLSGGLIGAMMFRAILTGAGDTTTPLFITIFQTPLALLVEWALVFGHLGLPRLGVRGVALGMAAGQVFALAVGLRVLFTGRVRLRLRAADLRPDPRLARRIMRLAWPPAVQMMGLVFTTFVYLRLAREFGAAVQAAYSIGLRVGMVIPLVSFPLASACATAVGQALGAGDVRRAWRAVGAGVLVHGGVLWAAAATLVVLRTPILSALSSDPEVVREGSRYLLFLGGNFALMGVQLVVMRSLQGAGDFLVPMAISLGGALLVSIPLGALAVHATSLGPAGLWGSSLLGAASSTAGMVAWLATGRWTRRALVARVEARASGG